MPHIGTGIPHPKRRPYGHGLKSNIRPKESSVQHNLNQKRAGRGPGRAALGAGAKEPLNKSSSAECRIFYHIRAVQKVGNTYSISPLFEGSAEAKSLGIRSCRLNQSFPSNSAPPRSASLVPFLPRQERNAPGRVGEHLSRKAAKPLRRFPFCFPAVGSKFVPSCVNPISVK